jgi:hypothetical protein
MVLKKMTNMIGTSDSPDLQVEIMKENELKPNSCTDNFVEVSGHNLENFQT